MEWIKCRLLLSTDDAEQGAKAVLGIGQESLVLMTSKRFWSLPYSSLTYEQSAPNRIILNHALVLERMEGSAQEVVTPLAESIEQSKRSHNELVKSLRWQLDLALNTLRTRHPLFDQNLEIDRLRVENQTLKRLMLLQEECFAVLRSKHLSPLPLLENRMVRRPKSQPLTQPCWIEGDNKLGRLELSELRRFCSSWRNVKGNDFLLTKIELFLEDIGNPLSSHIETQVIQEI